CVRWGSAVENANRGRIRFGGGVTLRFGEPLQKKGTSLAPSATYARVAGEWEVRRSLQHAEREYRGRRRLLGRRVRVRPRAPSTRHAAHPTAFGKIARLCWRLHRRTRCGTARLGSGRPSACVSATSRALRCRGGRR